MHAIMYDMDLKAFIEENSDIDVSLEFYQKTADILETKGFYHREGGLYTNNARDAHYQGIAVIMELAKINWAKKYIKNIQFFKIEDYSDVTALLKED